MPSVNDVALTRRRQQTLTRLRTITSNALGRRWTALDGYSDERPWLRSAGPVLAAGQRNAAATQLAYLRARLGPFDFDMDAILEKASIDLNQPFIALANALSNGLEFADAVEAGRLRAEGVGESGVQWAARAANDAVSDDERIVGWTRTLGPNPCDFCITVANQRYHSADSASFGHLRDNCGVDPIIGDRDPGRVLNGETF